MHASITKQEQITNSKRVFGRLCLTCTAEHPNDHLLGENEIEDLMTIWLEQNQLLKQYLVNLIIQ